MDVAPLLLSVLFGAVGLGFLAYAKAAGRLVPGLAGAALMAFPYFVSSVPLLLLVGGALTALPFVYRDA